MHWLRVFGLLLCLCLPGLGAGTPPAYPATLARDVVHARIATHADPSQQYSLYLPADYSGHRRWPVLLVLDPRGRAEEALQLTVDAARRQGWLVLSSHQSRSDGDEQVTLLALQSLLTEVQNHYAFDRQRIYLAGMSGTAKTLWVTLPYLHKVVAGMIGCAGGRPPELGKLALMPPAFFGMAGDVDFNHQEMRELDEALRPTATHHRLEIFPGGHGWPEGTAVMGRAIDWLELMAMHDGRTAVREEFVDAQFEIARGEVAAQSDPLARWRRLDQAIRDFDGLRPLEAMRDEAAQLDASAEVARLRAEEKRLRTLERRYAQDFDAWFTRFTTAMDQGQRRPPPDLPTSLRELRIASLQKALAAASPAEAASLQRRLERVYVATSYYLPNAMEARKDRARALAALQLATRVFPERPWSWWRLASLQASGKQTDEAILALQSARKLGWVDLESLANDPLWQPLRADPRWPELVAPLPAR